MMTNIFGQADASAAGLEGEDRAFWERRTVLVTGSNGFVGSWLATGLLTLGATVVGIVRDGVRGGLLGLENAPANLILLRGNLEDYTLVERALNEYEVDTCFHLAAQAIVGAANRSPLSTFESNIKGTWNVLEACRQTRSVERVVVASSDKAYGVQETLPYTEATELKGIYPYDASKACADILSRCYAASFSLPVTITRCANVYGGGDLNWNRIVPGTARSIINREAPIIRSDGTPERDYIYALDAVRAYLALGRNGHRPELRGEAFNFGSGSPVSVRTLVESMISASGNHGLKPEILGTGSLHAEIDRQYLDSTKARTVLGWQPRTELSHGLQLTLDWYEAYLADSPSHVELAV